VLEASSAKIAHVPNHVLGALKKYCHFSLRTITPYLEEAGACRDCGDSEAGASRDVQFSLTLQGDCKIKQFRLDLYSEIILYNVYFKCEFTL